MWIFVCGVVFKVSSVGVGGMETESSCGLYVVLSLQEHVVILLQSAVFPWAVTSVDIFEGRAVNYGCAFNTWFLLYVTNGVPTSLLPVCFFCLNGCSNPQSMTTSTRQTPDEVKKRSNLIFTAIAISWSPYLGGAMKCLSSKCPTYVKQQKKWVVVGLLRWP
ncbi:hypothetical protein GOP47_0014520 [Adiantum capillus-veneris]|uniref:Uncharacterized protein n=1 Tax=Adiantum capillus-veneris TaxID=13818 RepID=A0A9D4ZDK4_ADICA|nr:hypothetical protein GOP47_0014520 [Adiantum capillus-veneris]